MNRDSRLRETICLLARSMFNEELEYTARLAIMTRSFDARMLSAESEIALVTKFDVEWDA